MSHYMTLEECMRLRRMGGKYAREVNINNTDSQVQLLRSELNNIIREINGLSSRLNDLDNKLINLEIKEDKK